MESLLKLSATELARKIKQREITSEAAVGAHVAYARKVNPTLNAIVIDRYDEAMADAQAADARLVNEGPENLPQFHGVPCTIKEAFAYTGFPQTSGLVSRKHAVATQDATAVARIKAAGAIPLGITNVPELCMWMETHNRVYGRTNNPYNPSRIVGGSSGGEGSIVGSGASPFGLGSDVGGSIRMPAFFNGVFGHKCSSGTVPNTGQFPVAHGEALKYLATGPICRRAEDLMPLLRLLAGPDGRDPIVETRDLKDPIVDYSKLQVVNVRGNGAVDVAADLLAAQDRAARALADKGAKVKNVEITALNKSLDIWSSMLSAAGGPSFASMMADGKSFSPLLTLLAWTVRASDHTLPAIMLALLEPIGKLTPNRTKALVERGRALRQELAEIIGPDGVMLYPSYSQAAPPHLKPLRLTFHWVYTAILNTMEMPVTQVPLGLNEEGLPLGVQVAGVHGNDSLTIAVALELEKAFGGWVPPKMLEGHIAGKGKLVAA